jgi:hypothetical protein
MYPLRIRGRVLWIVCTTFVLRTVRCKLLAIHGFRTKFNKKAKFSREKATHFSLFGL